MATPTSLGRSPVTRLLDAADATTNPTSAEIHTQRYQDEMGAVQVTFNQDPVGTGEVIIEGRLDPTLGWAVVADSSTHPELDISTYSSTVLSQIAVDVAVVPEIRARVSGSSIAAGTTVTVDFME